MVMETNFLELCLSLITLIQLAKLVRSMELTFVTARSEGERGPKVSLGEMVNLLHVNLSVQVLAIQMQVG